MRKKGEKEKEIERERERDRERNMYYIQRVKRDTERSREKRKLLECIFMLNNDSVLNSQIKHLTLDEHQR